MNEFKTESDRTTSKPLSVSVVTRGVPTSSRLDHSHSVSFLTIKKFNISFFDFFNLTFSIISLTVKNKKFFIRTLIVYNELLSKLSTNLVLTF